MKKATLWSLALIAITVSSCSKTEIPTPATTASASYKKGATTGGGAQTAVTTYAGRSTGVDATITTINNGTVYSNQYLLAQTTALPLTGGSYNAQQAPASIGTVLNADSLYAVVTGQGSSTLAQAFASQLSIAAGGHTITASSVQTTASASCRLRSGSTQISNLVVNGTTITVTGAANQTVFFPTGGLLIINEQPNSKKGNTTSSTVTGLHLIVPNKADIKIAVASADIKC